MIKYVDNYPIFLFGINKYAYVERSHLKKIYKS